MNTALYKRCVFVVVLCLCALAVSAASAQITKADFTAQLREIKVQHTQLKADYVRAKRELEKKRRLKLRTLEETLEEYGTKSGVNRAIGRERVHLRNAYTQQRKALRQREKQLRVDRKKALRLGKEARKEMREEVRIKRRDNLIAQELDAWQGKNAGNLPIK